MRKIIVIFSIIVLLSCNNKNDKRERISNEKIGKSDEINNVDLLDISGLTNIEYMNKPTYKLKNNEIIFSNGALYGGIAYYTHITDDVNVYLLPNFDSRIKETLSKDTIILIIGISNNRETLENDDEYWVQIYYGEDAEYPFDPKIGWISSSFTNIENPCVTDLEIERIDISESGYYYLYGKYNLDNLVNEFSILANKLDNQDFYSFSWDYMEKAFHYSNKPGLYIWNENQNELRHISYIGGEGSKYGASHWSIVTDDFRYLIQDQGTAPPPRRINIWNLENGEEIFSSLYYRDINLKRHTIEIVEEYNWYSYYQGKWGNGYSLENFSDEEIIFAENFIEENDLPEAFSIWTTYVLLIVYEYNIETKEKKIIGGKYAFSQ